MSKCEPPGVGGLDRGQHGSRRGASSERPSGGGTVPAPARFRGIDGEEPGKRCAARSAIPIAAFWCAATPAAAVTPSISISSHLQPCGSRVQFRPNAILQYSKLHSASPGFEDSLPDVASQSFRRLGEVGKTMTRMRTKRLVRADEFVPAKYLLVSKG